MKLIPTSAACDLILQCLEIGEGFRVSKVALGNGADAGGAEAEELTNPLITCEITSITRVGGLLRLNVAKSNNTNSQGFKVTEIGVYVDDPEHEGEYILFGYLHIEDDKAAYFAAASEYSYEYTNSIQVYVGAVENISVILGQSLVYASQSDYEALLLAFQQHINNFNNPHQTPIPTLEDIIPLYTIATQLAELIGGESMGEILGMLAKLIQVVISHINNTNNPHQDNPAGIGAAAASHVHKAGDITSGQMTVARGGTGKGSWALNRIPYLSKTDEFSQIAFPSKAGMVLHQNTSGAPFWAFASATETGSYSGHSKASGSASSITFTKGVPKFILICKRSANKSAFWAVSRQPAYAFIFPHAGFGTAFFPPPWDMNADTFEDATGDDWKDFITKANYLYVTYTGNRVDWATPRGGEWQLDGSSSDTYDYIGYY